MFITVSRKDIAIGPKGRLVTAGVVSTLLHVVMFWALINTRYHEPVEPYDDTSPTYELQLVDVTKPPPEPKPQPDVELKPHEIPPEPPQEQPPQPEEAKTEPQPAPQPEPQPTQQIRSKAVQEESFDKPQTARQLAEQKTSTNDSRVSSLMPSPIRAKSVSQDNEALDRPQTATKLAQQQLNSGDVNAPSATVAPHVGISARKKKDDEDDAGLKSGGGAKALTDLVLHQPAGGPGALAPAGGSGAPAGGGVPSGMPGLPSVGQLAGVNGGKTGGGGDGLKGGRGKLTQAMQNHDYCNEQVKDGKPVPVNCDMTALNGKTDLGLKNDKILQTAAAKVDKDYRYKTTPGSPDSWASGVRQPSDPPNKDDQPKYGDYSSGKRQRVVGQCSLTASCTDDGQETRKPGDPKPEG